MVITGVFSLNDSFVKLLAFRFPKKEIFTGSPSHASALGAAMALNDEYAKKKLKDLLSLEKHYPLVNVDMSQYDWKERYCKLTLSWRFVYCNWRIGFDRIEVL